VCHVALRRTDVKTQPAVRALKLDACGTAVATGVDAQFVLVGNLPTGRQLECRLAVGHALLCGLCAEFELLPHESGPDVEFLQLHADGTRMDALLSAVVPALKIGQHEPGDHPDDGDRRHHFNEREPPLLFSGGLRMACPLGHLAEMSAFKPSPPG